VRERNVLKRLARRALVVGCIGAACVGGRANADDAPIKIGVLTDMSSVYADGAGKGSVEAAQLAIEDAGDVLGKPVELVSADHQNKPDLGTAIARQWYDRDGVDMITDVPGSPVGFAVQTMSLQYKKLALLVASTSSDITGPKCTPYSAMWGVDTYTLSNILGSYLTSTGLDTWFFIALDGAVGRTFVSEGTQFIAANGGKVLGATYAPINSADFSSFLLQAQASKAKVIGLANAGADTVTSIQQAVEFGLVRGGQKFAAFIVLEGALRSLGLETAQGLLVAAPFFWNLNDETRAWSARFEKRMGRPPTWNHALVYSAVNHYLKAVKAAGTRDPDMVMARMRELPIEDPATQNGKLRIDGRVVRDDYLFEVKKPSEAKSDWDLYKLVRVIPGTEATRPLDKGGCPLVK
jgi:branched-chain amino acid transport system substrate-binding protein